MNIRFRPSLQLLAKVRIALKLLLKLDFRIVLADLLREHGGMESFYKECIHQNGPGLSLEFTVERNIVSVVRTMVTEIVEWCDCHGDFLPDAGFGNWGIICWYSHGTIDYLATARALLQDENLNRRQRFILIYKYCLQDEQTQSEEMFADDLTYVSRIAGLSTTLRSWMDALRSNNPVSWKQITHEVEFGRYYRSKKIQFSENYLGLLHYFKKLTNPEARYRCLYLALGNDSIRPFYLYMCLAGLPDYEVDAMFNRFSERKRYLVIQSFLHWPLQCIFLSIIERFRNRISNQIYLDLFKFILFEIFERELFDYEYVSLVKQFWAPLSEETKRFVRENGLYPCIAYIMKHNDQDTISADYFGLYNKWR